MMDDSPRVRPISVGVDGRIASRTPNPHNIPLAPAPHHSQKRGNNHVTGSQDSLNISGIPNDLIIRPTASRRPPPPLPTPTPANTTTHIPTPTSIPIPTVAPPTPPPSNGKEASVNGTTPPTTATLQKQQQYQQSQLSTSSSSKKAYSIYSTFGHDAYNSGSSESAIHIVKEERQQQRQQQRRSELPTTSSVPPPLPSSSSQKKQISLTRHESMNTSHFPPPPSDNLAQIVANNMQRKPGRVATTTYKDSLEPASVTVVETSSIDSFNTIETMEEDRTGFRRDSLCDPIMSAIKEEPTTMITASSDTSDDSEEDEDEDDDEEEEEDEDDVFVDATGYSQDDIERERGENKLSKRLSGGHFGSAGGLMLATAAAETANMPKHQKRKSRPPPEDIAQAMLNWKRHSGSGANKRMSGISAIAKWASENGGNKSTEGQEGELTSTDKQTSRDKAAEALSGSNNRMNTNPTPPPEEKPLSITPPPPPISTPTPTPTTIQKVIQQEPQPQKQLEQPQKQLEQPQKQLEQPQKPEHHQRDRSLSILSDDFSKSLDDAWNDPDPGIAQVLDPRLSPEPEEDRKPIPSKKHTDQETQEAAHHLWNEDDVIAPREKIAEWLGQGKSFNNDVLVHYMKNFQFSHMRLDSAFRKLCSKLYFKAEAQQIDRILEVFAGRYWSCNPRSILKSADVVYAVVYSVLLLNTDLHVAQGNYSRMTRQEFIRNTMAAVHDQQSVCIEIEKGSPEFSREWELEVESYLKELYTSVKQYQILQPLTRKSSIQESPEKRGSILGGKRVVGLKRSVGSIIRRSARESMLFPEEVQPRTSSSSGPRPSSPLPRSPRRESFSSISSATSFGSRAARVSTLSPTFQPMISFMDTHGSSLFANEPPYIKEGVVMRKHLLENATHKARHRDWKECLLVVTEGELKMYALQSSNNNGDMDRRNMLRSSSASFANLADSLSKTTSPTSTSFGGATENKWASHSQLIGSIALNHTLSNVLPPPGYNRQRPHVFAIQQPDGGVYLFQASSLDQVNQWVQTCNYWAARQSKEPLAGGVSNMEYGWGTCLQDVIMNLDTDEAEVHGQQFQDPDAISIFDWRPPSSPLVSSTLNEKEQYQTLQKHLKALDNEIDNHRELKTRMIAKFPSRSQNHVKAMHNWEAKSKYLLHDIIKYQNYCDALEKSIQIQEQHQKALDGSEKLQQEDEDNINNIHEIQLDYHQTDVDLVKEISDQLRLVF
ncbi:hypothetical protein INT45_004928 [Circinella minor]|uniref:SEC7 domain-containing protein n=1 Tax=Circinella minor TaxID=1195481 RepID=A0A8H7RVS6_9FUNG|nr:hypothetical protein INT45_004928 [Circinella minor]